MEPMHTNAEFNIEANTISKEVDGVGPWHHNIPLSHSAIESMTKKIYQIIKRNTYYFLNSLV